MRRYLKWATIGCAFGAIAAIFVFPVWQAWVYQFQTLITGALAVFAAHYTVRQMQRSDQKSDERHNQLMDLSVRPIRLKVNRSVFPMVELIEDALDDIDGWRRRLGADDGAWFLSQNAIDFDEVVRKWHAMVNNEQLQIAQDYYGGDMVFALHRSKETARDVLAMLTTIGMKLVHRTPYPDDPVWVKEILQLDVQKVHSHFAVLQEYLGEFADGLRKLERDYLKPAEFGGSQDSVLAWIARHPRLDLDID
ncbi:hypothetical protein ACU8NW_14790 [Rhizobium leguminosarum]